MNLEAIRDKVDIVSIVSMYTVLKRKGPDSYFASCPFHREKTESFHVVPSKRLWKCFGCGATGSPFDFVMKVEGIDFVSAVKKVAQVSGIQIEDNRRPMTPEEIRQEKQNRERAKSLMVEAERWRRIDRPPMLWIYGKPASPQQILGAYERACKEEPGLRDWIRRDMWHCESIVNRILGYYRIAIEREEQEVIEW